LSQKLPQTVSVSAAQAPLQLLKPARQLTPQETPLHVATPLGSVSGQGEQLEPQEFRLELLTQLPLQPWKPLTQLLSEQVPVAVLQLPAPFGKAVVQLVREAPQTVSLLASQPPPKAWKPVLQVTAQVPAVTSQVDVEFAIAVQSTGGDPHALSVLAVHAPPSAWKPAAQLATVQAPFGVVASTVQAPEPWAMEFVQSLQPGPGPQQVLELTSQAVLLTLVWKPWLQLATPQMPPGRQVMVPCGSWWVASVQSTPLQALTASETQVWPTA
jgi:hypothetical protein